MSEPREQYPREVRDQLQRVVMSPVFVHSERLRRFLTHCVETALGGRLEDLKEYTIGVVAFDRPSHYNPAEDPIVRVEARRLRKKLDEYYQTIGAADPVVIQLPKGGYLPVFEFRETDVVEPAPPRRRFQRGAAIAFGLCSVLVGYWLLSNRRTPAPEFSLTRLTSDRGLTTDPALSHDGSLLVYASDRSSAGDLDIWFQPLNQQEPGSGPLQLTRDPSDDSQPAISPDGSMVAFRSERQPPGIYLVPASGGSARLFAADGRNPRYSPDGRWIAYWVGSPGGDSLPPAGKAYVMASTGGTARRLLANFGSAACPVWSPDGRSLLVAAAQAPADGVEFRAVSLDGDHSNTTGIARAAEQARLRFAWRECPVSWGEGAFVFSALEGDAQNLWRLPARPDGRTSGPIARLTFGSAEEVLPFQALSGSVAFAGRNAATDIWRLSVEHPDLPIRVTDGAATATFPQGRGNRLTYVSKTQGRSVVWLRDLRTGVETQLARSGEPQFPQICPDGETVVYSDGPNAFSVTAQSAGAARLLCNGCSRVWQCNDRGLFYVPAGSKSPVEIDEFPLPQGPKNPLVVSSDYDLANAQKSADGWLAFHAITGISQRRIFVAPYHRGTATSRQEWIPVTDGAHMDRNAVWNGRSDTLYFLSERCGFRCIWSQRVDVATKQPIGEPQVVRHFHSARLGLSAIGDVGAVGLSFSDGYVYFSQSEQRGDVWLARPGTITH